MDSNRADEEDYGRKSQIERQNLEIRNHGYLEVPAEMDLRHCPSSLSGFTALSIGSRVPRPCQILRSGRTGFSSSHRATPSLLLQHGYDWISDEDQKILNLMVARREAQIEAANLSISARNLWENDKIAYNQMMNEKQKQWSEYVQQKRRLEKEELERRKESASKTIKFQLAELEERINERHARCERKHREMMNKKRLNQGFVDTEGLCHRLRRDQMAEEEELRSNLHVSEIAAKERQVEDNLKAIACYKQRLIRERSYKREKKMEAAHLLREAFKQKFNECCEENRRVLSSKLRHSEYRALRAVEVRRKMAQDKNYLKRLQHSNTMAALTEEDHAKELMARQELLMKENKIRSHIEKKEQFKSRSRMNALTTAHLRLKIKSSFHLID